jgi:hypothetical protein
MTKENLIDAILAMVHCGDPAEDDTDIGISVTEIRAMSIAELQSLYDSVKSFGDHLDNL